MRAAIHNPYLDTLGGGERYTVGVCRVLVEHGYTVDLEWNDSGIIRKIENRFGMKLPGVNVLPDIKRGDGYDFCFWVSDGSIPILHARKNVLHFQVPFHNVKGKSLINKMKLFRVNSIVCNSIFTKNVIDAEFGVKSKVIYPPVDTEKFRSKRKEDLIIFVGRFSKLMQSKGQEILIKAFKKFSEGNNNWKMVLAGGVEIGVSDELKKLEKESLGYPITLLKSPTFNEIRDLYGKAKFFWSASGFDVKETREPEKVEHFGITTVEAMSAGAVPIVFDAGGSKEIIDDGVNGFLWKKMETLVKKTLVLVKDKKFWRKMSAASQARAQNFGYAKFEKEISSLL